MADIVILGAGPAGCVAAIHLRRLGFAVALIGAPVRGGPNGAIEGASPRVVEGFRRAGCAAAVAALGPLARRRAVWDGATSDHNGEYLVARASFDQALREDARNAGVTVIDGRVAGYERLGDIWQVSLRGGRPVMASGFLVEARGRRAPRGRQVAQRGAPPLALRRRYIGLKPGPARSGAASFRDGWAWFADFGKGEASLQFFLDHPGAGTHPGAGDRSGAGSHPGAGGRSGAGGGDRAVLFEAALAACREARAWVSGGRPSGPVLAREATALRHARPLEERLIRIGDAAMAIDPLSGHGLFEAVGGAMAAAPVINTLLNRPGDGALARAFYDARQSTGFLRHARIGRDFYRAESRWPTRPFWAARRVWPDDEPGHVEPVAGVGEICRRPVVCDGFITQREVVVTPDQPRGVLMLAGVPLAALWRALGAGAAFDAGAPDYTSLAEHFGVTPGQIAEAAGWLMARGLIRSMPGG
jgi:flavin-dependent dehydrogenase